MIKLKRAYEESEAADGPRYLVDRLWPRGIAKASLHIENWLKDVAPSNNLRRWFGRPWRRVAQRGPLDVRLEFARRKGGSALAFPDIISNKVQLIFDNLPTALEQSRGGSVRALATSAGPDVNSGIVVTRPASPA